MKDEEALLIVENILTQYEENFSNELKIAFQHVVDMAKFKHSRNTDTHLKHDNWVIDIDESDSLHIVNIRNNATIAIKPIASNSIMIKEVI